MYANKLFTGMCRRPFEPISLGLFLPAVPRPPTPSPSAVKTPLLQKKKIVVILFPLLYLFCTSAFDCFSSLLSPYPLIFFFIIGLIWVPILGDFPIPFSSLRRSLFTPTISYWCMPKIHRANVTWVISAVMRTENQETRMMDNDRTTWPTWQNVTEFGMIESWLQEETLL